MSFTKIFGLALCTLTITIGGSSSLDESWCSLEFTCNTSTTSSSKNTMCLYEEKKSIWLCRSQENVMSYSMKQLLLGSHNGMRNLMAAAQVDSPWAWGFPMAANMRQITWDDTMAEVATRWAFQCRTEKDKCRITKNFKYDWVRQNFYFDDELKKRGTVFDGVKGWVLGIKYADPKSVDNLNFSRSVEAMPFFSVMWANIFKMGCGVVYNRKRYCKDKTCNRVDWRKGIRLVCNYAPAKMHPDEIAWANGTPCSKCPPGTGCNPESTYRNLCALPGDPSDEVPVNVLVASDKSNIGFTVLLALEIIFVSWNTCYSSW